MRNQNVITCCCLFVCFAGIVCADGSGNSSTSSTLSDTPIDMTKGGTVSTEEIMATLDGTRPDGPLGLDKTTPEGMGVKTVNGPYKPEEIWAVFPTVKDLEYGRQRYSFGKNAISCEKETRPCMQGAQVYQFACIEEEGDTRRSSDFDVIDFPSTNQAREFFNVDGIIPGDPIPPFDFVTYHSRGYNRVQDTSVRFSGRLKNFTLVYSEHLSLQSDEKTKAIIKEMGEKLAVLAARPRPDKKKVASTPSVGK
jgi:hypothetical protein